MEKYDKKVFERGFYHLGADVWIINSDNKILIQKRSPLKRLEPNVCGRIGRLLIPLYIQSKGMLDKSCLYISDYIERNKDTYYDMLTRVRTHNDIIAWIKFFLEAVIETSKTAKEKFRNVVELTMEMDKVIMDLPVKPENAKKVLDVLYDEPIVSRKKILELIDIKPTTLNVCINALKEKNIIIETTGYSRNQVFAFQTYIDLFLK